MPVPENMLMPVKFFNDIYYLLALLLDEDLSPEAKIAAESIASQLSEKNEALKKREAFTAYKTSRQGSDEREAARKVYLEKARIHKDFQTQEETTV